MAIDSTLVKWQTEIAYAFAIQLLGVVIMLYLCATQGKADPSRLGRSSAPDIPLA